MCLNIQCMRMMHSKGAGMAGAPSLSWGGMVGVMGMMPKMVVIVMGVTLSAFVAN